MAPCLRLRLVQQVLSGLRRVDPQGVFTNKRRCCCTWTFCTTLPSTCSIFRRVRDQPEQHDQACSEQPEDESHPSMATPTDIIFGPSIDGDMYEPTVIVTRNCPSESPSPELQHELVKKTNNPTQLLNSFNNATKGFYRHTVGTRSDSQADFERCFAPYGFYFLVKDGLKDLALACTRYAQSPNYGTCEQA